MTRFREAYSTPGPTFGDVRESVIQAMDTAGRAVLFAGCTVVIALLGMMLLGVDFLYGVAISASIGVLLVMLGSLTLLPALLTFAGSAPGASRPARAQAGRAGHRRAPGWYVAALERLRAEAFLEHRNRRGTRDAGDRCSRDSTSTGLQRRQQRPDPHHYL